MSTEIAPGVTVTVLPPKHLTRTGLMLTLAPVVHATLNAIPEVKAVLALPVTPETYPMVRRCFRALLTLGVKLMLDAAIPPHLILDECKVAIMNELNERGVKAKEQGATQAPALIPS